MGVQDGRKCYCGDSFGRHGESTLCNEPCSGDGDQVCGAKNVNSVYTFLRGEDVDRSHSDAAREDQGSVCSEGRCGCFVNGSMGGPLLKGGKVANRYVNTNVGVDVTCWVEGQHSHPFHM